MLGRDEVLLVRGRAGARPSLGSPNTMVYHAQAPSGAAGPHHTRDIREALVKPFPSEFLWGTAQSGHQIEGENFNSDWWRWEQRPGRIADGAISKEAAQHWTRFESDLDLARDLGHRAFLFSLEWARIQPAPDRFDDAALEHYRDVFEALHARHLEPICVMQHVTTPRWFAERYGWRHKKAPDLFAAYAHRIAHEFSPLCRWWIPLREPMHWVTMSYVLRRWPPASARIEYGRLALMNMARAHARAYDALHRAREDALVGPAIHARRFTALDPHSAWDVRTQRREHRRCNHLLLKALTTGKWPLHLDCDREVLGKLDFIGVAYYGIETVRFALTRPLRLFAQLTDTQGRALNRIHCAPDPGGFRAVVQELTRYRLPILVTANGLPTDDDRERSHYLLDHVSALRHAMSSGADVRGYCVRSLLDGFEWDAGYSQRFGLVHVDHRTQARTPNPSALLYKELCRTGTISDGAVARFCPGWREPTTEAV